MIRKRYPLSFFLPSISAVLLFLPSCKEELLYHARPPFSVVDGTPEVGEGGSDVDFSPPESDPSIFAYSESIRVDVFRQDMVRKVDILWLVDNSPSMTAVQMNLSRNFAAFIHDLAYAEPSVDYRIAVLTPDTYTEGGELRSITGFPAYKYIACNSGLWDTQCNVGSLQQAEEAFRNTVLVGADGQPVERGLLAVHLALSEPMISAVNDNFMRDDAALYIILVSDEGDASCDPVLVEPRSGDYRECTFYPDCRCEDDENLSFGSVDYFVRFLNGLKGYGNEDMVKVAAIVGDDREDVRLCVRYGATECAQWGDYRGCRNINEGMHAVYAPRYIETAERTGGVTVSICEDDYSSALSEIGFAASGQKRDFQLSRVPVPHEREPFRVMILSLEDGRRIRKIVPHKEGSVEGGWAYIACENDVEVNSIRFYGHWIPPPNSLIEVAYHVDAAGSVICN